VLGSLFYTYTSARFTLGRSRLSRMIVLLMQLLSHPSMCGEEGK
jgi:hypothetical protein